MRFTNLAHSEITWKRYMEKLIKNKSTKNISVKVQLFWEGHKNLRNFPHDFDIYLVNVKTMRKIAQTLGAFSEKLTFKHISKVIKMFNKNLTHFVCLTCKHHNLDMQRIEIFTYII